MDDKEWAYRLADLLEQDTDYIVDVLELTAEDIINAFPRRVDKFLESEWE